MTGWPTQKPDSTTQRMIGVCRWQEDGSLKVKIDDEPVIRFMPDKLPDNIKKLALKGKLQFAMNARKDTIYSLIPAEGAFVAKFDSFQVGKDEKLPEPHHITGKGQTQDGKTYPKDYWGFTALCRIIEGDFNSIVVPYFLRYDPFYQGDENGQPIAGIKMTKYGEKLLDFLQTVGVEDSIPWSDNLLPELMKRILKADRKFRIIIKKGYIDSIVSEEGVDFTDPEDADFTEEK